ncbi:MAG: hypothetical protein K2H09_05945 [Treponemataceae bacterium]|nr:hypothetical protein [Treponemataceae bacterium]
MGKQILLAAAAAFLSAAAAALPPPELAGIWQGADRIVLFGEQDQLSVILKLYYGWYYDRAAEPAESSSLQPRSANAATAPAPASINVSYEQIAEGVPAWELSLRYGGAETARIPVAVIDGALFLSFLIHYPQESSQPESAGGAISGYWQGLNCADSLRISGRRRREDIISWYILEGAAYKLRFWRTDMEFDGEAAAAFTDGSSLFTVNKHIRSGGATFTCANGRSAHIRNVEKFASLPEECTLDAGGRICGIGAPYLRRADKDDAESLLAIVAEANARRRPPPPPLFPPEDLDWHWDLINQLEQGNGLIQAVRGRQREFGARGAETAGRP